MSTLSGASPSKSKILKNIIFLSASHYLLNQTTLTLNNLQSSINGEKGVISLAVQYGMAMLFILLFSDILIKSLKTCKKMLVLMIALQLPFHASNLYPMWKTMLPTSAIAGATLGLIPMCYSLYINEMSVLYHSSQGTQSLETITSKFFGIFTFFALNSSIWGNLIAYFILRPDAVPLIILPANISCGIDFDENMLKDNGNLHPPPDEKRYVLVGVCLASTVLSIVLVVAFVDELVLRADQAVVGMSRCRSIMMSLSSVVRHACVPDQMLLLPLSVFFGMQGAFFNADFTKAFVACSWGVHHIGFVAMSYGVCGAIMSGTIGTLVKNTSQMFTMILGAFLNVSVIIFLCLWDPSADFMPAYFIVAGVWGINDAIWWTQLSAVHGLLFPQNEAAFSVMYFCVFLGFTFNFSTSTYLSVRVKIAVLLSFLVTGMVGYLTGQIKIRIARKRKHAATT